MLFSNTSSKDDGDDDDEDEECAFCVGVLIVSGACPWCFFFGGVRGGVFGTTLSN